MTLYLNQLIFLIINYIIIRIHARRFDKNIPINSGFHFWWGLATIAVGVVLVWVSHWNWWFAGALIAMRAWVYNPLLSYSRHPHMPFFYISKNDKHNSFLDTLVYREYKIWWFIALFMWGWLQYKIYQG